MIFVPDFDKKSAATTEKQILTGTLVIGGAHCKELQQPS